MKHRYFVSYIFNKHNDPYMHIGNSTICREKIKNNDDLLELQKDIASADAEINNVCILFWRRYE